MTNSVKSEESNWFLRVKTVILIVFGVDLVLFFIMSILESDSLVKGILFFFVVGLGASAMSGLIAYIPITFMVHLLKYFQKHFSINAQDIRWTGNAGMVSGILYLAGYPVYLLSFDSAMASIGFFILPPIAFLLMPLGSLLGYMASVFVGTKR